MSIAQTRITQQVSVIDLLKELAQLIDPESIEQTHRLVRKEQELTDKEIQTAIEAREFIKNYDSLRTDLDKRKCELEDSILEHKQKADIFIKESNKFIEFHKEQSQLLSNEKAALLENETQYKIDLRNLEEEKTRLYAMIERFQLELNEKELQFESLQNSLTSRETSLNAKISELQDKAAIAQNMFK